MKFKALVCMLFLATISFGQNMVQVGISGSSNLVRVVNLKEKGLIVLDKAPDGRLVMRKFDKNLSILWDIDTDLPNRADFLEEFVDDKFMYLLLDTKSSNTLNVIKVSTSFAASQKFNIKALQGLEVNDFKASDDLICISGNVKNEPILIFYEPSTNSVRYISANLKGQTVVQDIVIDKDAVQVSFLNKSRKKTELIVRTYSFMGKLLASKNLQAKDGFEFLSTKYFELEGQKFLVGNYGLTNSSRDDSNNSQGLYITNTTKGFSTRYYSFDQLSSFFNFLSEKQQEKITKQVAKRKKKGGEYRFSYRLHINELLKINENLVISAEVFVPEYRSNNYGSPFFGNPLYYQSSIWGRQYLRNNYFYNNPMMSGYNSRNGQFFDGFRYIEGLTLSINNEGNIVWDKSVPYKNLKYYDLKAHLKVSENDNKPVMSYISQDKLLVKELNNQGDEIKHSAITKELDEAMVGKRKADLDNFEHWYGNYFLNWGVIKNPSGSNSFKMNCFIQKIAY
jgi:hypothetical protein